MNTQTLPTVEPGHFRLLTLKENGKLSQGDTLETHRLGVCTVAYIQSTSAIVVTDRCGKYYNLSGLHLPGVRMQTKGATA